MLPITAIRGPINTVAFPALSRLQNEPEAFRSYYLKTTTLIAMLSMPLAAFFFIASEPIIELLLGRQWHEVSRIFSFLAIAAFIQPTSGFAGSLVLSLGNGRRFFYFGLMNSIVISICFMIGVHWGALGVAIAYSIGTYLLLYPWLSWAFRDLPVTFNMFVRACIFPAAISILGIFGASVAATFLVFSLPLSQICVLGLAFVALPSPLFMFSAEGRKVIKLLLSIKAQFQRC